MAASPRHLPRPVGRANSVARHSTTTRALEVVLRIRGRGTLSTTAMIVKRRNTIPRRTTGIGITGRTVTETGIGDGIKSAKGKETGIVLLTRKTEAIPTSIRILIVAAADVSGRMTPQRGRVEMSIVIGDIAGSTPRMVMTRSQNPSRHATSMMKTDQGRHLLILSLDGLEGTAVAARTATLTARGGTGTETGTGTGIERETGTGTAMVVSPVIGHTATGIEKRTGTGIETGTEIATAKRTAAIVIRTETEIVNTDTVAAGRQMMSLLPWTSPEPRVIGVARAWRSRAVVRRLTGAGGVR